MTAKWWSEICAPAWLIVACIVLPLRTAAGGSISGTLKTKAAPGRTVVYLKSVPEKLFVSTPIRLKLSQKGARFSPHLLAVLKGTTVDMTNDDWIEHSVYSMSLAKVFDIGLYGKNVKREVIFDKEGKVELNCYIHKKMNGVILVLQNPFFTRPKPDGTFVLEEVPAGTYDLRVFRLDEDERSIPVTVPAEGQVAAVVP